MASATSVKSAPPATFPSGNTCAAQNQTNCLSYQPNRNFCTACASPYILTAGTCRMNNSVNCLTYNPTSNLCLQCDPNYFFLSGGCASSFDLKCSAIVLVGTLCPDCKATFFPDPAARKIVLQNVANCITYTANTNTCTRCEEGL